MFPPPGGDKGKSKLSKEVLTTGTNIAQQVQDQSFSLGTSLQSGLSRSQSFEATNRQGLSPEHGPVKMNHLAAPVTMQAAGFPYPGVQSFAPVMASQGFPVQQMGYPYVTMNQPVQEKMPEYHHPILIGGALGAENKLGRKRLLGAEVPEPVWLDSEVKLLFSLVNASMQNAQFLGTSGLGYQFWEGISRHFPSKTSMECKNKWDQLTMPAASAVSYLQHPMLGFAGAGPQQKKLKARLQKKKPWSEEEKKIIETMQKSIGNRWTVIARKLNFRTSNDVKNYWYSRKRSLAKREQLLEGTKNPGNEESPSENTQKSDSDIKDESAANKDNKSILTTSAEGNVSENQESSKETDQSQVRNLNNE